MVAWYVIQHLLFASPDQIPGNQLLKADQDNVDSLELRLVYFGVFAGRICMQIWNLYMCILCVQQTNVSVCVPELVLTAVAITCGSQMVLGFPCNNT